MRVKVGSYVVNFDCVIKAERSDGEKGLLFMGFKKKVLTLISGGNGGELFIPCTDKRADELEQAFLEKGYADISDLVKSSK